MFTICVSVCWHVYLLGRRFIKIFPCTINSSQLSSRSSLDSGNSLCDQHLPQAMVSCFKAHPHFVVPAPFLPAAHLRGAWKLFGFATEGNFTTIIISNKRVSAWGKSATFFLPAVWTNEGKKEMWRSPQKNQNLFLNHSSYRCDDRGRVGIMVFLSPKQRRFDKLVPKRKSLDKYLIKSFFCKESSDRVVTVGRFCTCPQRLISPCQWNSPLTFQSTTADTGWMRTRIESITHWKWLFHRLTQWETRWPPVTPVVYTQHLRPNVQSWSPEAPA